MDEIKSLQCLSVNERWERRKEKREMGNEDKIID